MGEGFKQNYLQTIGADFAVKRLVEDGSQVAQIWDLAGQPRFSVVRSGYYIGCKGAILVFDISRPESFYSLPDWITELMNNVGVGEPLPMVLVGNKADLRDHTDNPIEVDQGEEYAKQLSDWANMEVPFLESSALTGFNVDKVFNSLIVNIDTKFHPF